MARPFVLDPEHTAILLDALVRAGLVRGTDDGPYEFDPAGESDRAAPPAHPVPDAPLPGPKARQWV